MAILDVLKKNKEEDVSKDKETVASKEKVETSSKKDSAVSNSKMSKQKGATLHNILRHPYITEKAAILAESNTYTFEVDPHAGKIEIARAVKQMYNVEPVRVNIIKLPAKKVMVRGTRGVKKAIKKAVVYLKKGDKIEFV